MKIATHDVIERVLEQEIAACADLKDWHGISPENIKSYLVRPLVRCQVFDEINGVVLDLWRVLDEAPSDPSAGYLVVYDDEAGMFGIATKPTSSNPAILVGYYGSLRGALEGM